MEDTPGPSTSKGANAVLAPNVLRAWWWHDRSSPGGALPTVPLTRYRPDRAMPMSGTAGAVAVAAAGGASGANRTAATPPSKGADRKHPTDDQGCLLGLGALTPTCPSRPLSPSRQASDPVRPIAMS